MADSTADLTLRPLSTEPALENGEAGEKTMYDVDPRQWGKQFWSTFHLVAYAYPEEPNKSTKRATFQFFDAMRFILPCSECRAGYRERWQMFDLRKHLDTRSSLIEWVILVHDSVNQKLGAAPLDYAEFMETLIGENVVEEDTDEPDNDAKDADEESAKTPERNTQKSETQPQQRATKQRAHSSDSAYAVALRNGESDNSPMEGRRVRGARKAAFEHARLLQNEQRRQMRQSKSKTANRLQSYHAARFALQSREQVSRHRRSSSSVAKSVRAPRECENCNRKTMVPSVFS